MVPFVNSFQLPNMLVDEYMLKMPDLSFKCYVFIARKTLGWQKESDAISLSQFQKAGLAATNRTNLLKALKFLENEELILIDRTKNINRYSLVLVKHQTSACEAPVASACEAPTKDTITKDTITKESKRELLDSEFDIFWQSYPRKDARIPGKKAFSKLNKAEIKDLLNLLPSIVENYKETQKQHIPLPASFINAHRWEDEVYLNKKIAKNGAVFPEDVKMERCLRRFVAKSDGDEVEFEMIDVAVLEALRMDEDEAIDMLLMFGMNMFKNKVQGVWKDVKKRVAA